MKLKTIILILFALTNIEAAMDNTLIEQTNFKIPQDFTCLHPLDKKSMPQELHLSAKALAYGKIDEAVRHIGVFINEYTSSKDASNLFPDFNYEEVYKKTEEKYKSCFEELTERFGREPYDKTKYTMEDFLYEIFLEACAWDYWYPYQMECKQ